MTEFGVTPVQLIQRLIDQLNEAAKCAREDGSPVRFVLSPDAQSVGLGDGHIGTHEQRVAALDADIDAANKSDAQ